MYPLVWSTNNAIFYSRCPEGYKGGDVVPAYKFIGQYGGEDMDRGNPSPREHVRSAIRKRPMRMCDRKSAEGGLTSSCAEFAKVWRSFHGERDIWTDY